MRSAKICVVFLLCALALAGCNTVPPTEVQQPMTARPAPVPQPQPQAANGSIYRAAHPAQPYYGYRPLFEDRRPRQVGDILVIQINEKTAASKNSDSTVEKSQTSTFGVTSLLGLPGKSFLGSNLDANSESKFDGKGAAASNNDFTGTITVTVIDVLPNGNLQVSGEKQIGINEGSEFIRFSGVVNPANIANGNSVSSSQVADARIEYRANGQIQSAQVMGWLARFFLTFLPF
ncbi:MAG: flagellar basal body L-ring protein FlgH [Burkholderiales bacterium]|nr:flagellar basal body L-ring protein FlgH [Burkholderiales bacterium]